MSTPIIVNANLPIFNPPEYYPELLSNGLSADAQKTVSAFITANSNSFSYTAMARLLGLPLKVLKAVSGKRPTINTQMIAVVHAYDDAEEYDKLFAEGCI